MNVSERVLALTAELYEVEEQLRSEPLLERAIVQRFRNAMDAARLTAWNMDALVMMRENREDPNKVLNILTAERVRRFTQLATDLYSDIKKGTITAQSSGMEMLKNALEMLMTEVEQLAPGSS